MHEALVSETCSRRAIDAALAPHSIPTWIRRASQRAVPVYLLNESLRL